VLDQVAFDCSVPAVAVPSRIAILGFVSRVKYTFTSLSTADRAISESEFERSTKTKSIPALLSHLACCVITVAFSDEYSPSTGVASGLVQLTIVFHHTS